MGTVNHRAEVICISELIKHPNADQLSLIHIGGYQVVVRTENYSVGDLAIFIQPDSVVPDIPQFSWIWEKDGAGNPRVFTGPVPEEYRRVTVRKFRKEISEGLLVPLRDFPQFYDSIPQLIGSGETPVEYPIVKPGEDVASPLGITHWEPKEDADTTGENEQAPGRKFRFPRTLSGWFWLVKSWIGIKPPQEHEVGVERPVYDVENYKNFVGAILPGEECWATEKIHGSNARYTYQDGHMYAGSRNLWKSEAAQGCIWRRVLAVNPLISAWCKFHRGYTLYGEVVPTQKNFHYGATAENPRFFLFDVRNPKGEWVERGSDEWFILNVSEFLTDLTVPVVYCGPFDEGKFKTLADGPSLVPGANHIREGIVVKPMREAQAIDRGVRGLGRVQLKLVSNKFLEKDGAV